MMTSRKADRLAGDFGTLAPDGNRNWLFTFDVQALETGGGPPGLCDTARPVHAQRPDAPPPRPWHPFDDHARRAPEADHGRPPGPGARE